MKALFCVVLAVLLFSASFAGAWNYENKNKGTRPYEDAWGNNYKTQQNMWKDTDRDGVPNYYDYNDRNRNIQTPYQKNYNNPYDYKRKY